MQIDFEEAVKIFESIFDDTLKSPYLHPSYVVLDAIRDPSLKPIFFVYQEGVRYFYYAFHLAKVPNSSFNDIQSPMGYGGPITNSNDPQFLANSWKSFTDWCMEQSILAEFVRFHPSLKNQQIFAGEVVTDRDIVSIDLNCKDLLMSYGKRARTAIRKAQKNDLKIEWWQAEEFCPMFEKLYLGHMQILKADDFYLFSSEYLRALSKWDHAHLGVCKLGKDVLGAAIFITGPKHIEYHLSASTDIGRNLCATNLLIYEAGLLGQKLGCEEMNLGGGTTSAPDNALLFFKMSFSQIKKSFCIGKRVHMPREYNALKEEWETMKKGNTNRILFYR